MVVVSREVPVLRNKYSSPQVLTIVLLLRGLSASVQTPLAHRNDMARWRGKSMGPGHAMILGSS